MQAERDVLVRSVFSRLRDDLQKNAFIVSILSSPLDSGWIFPSGIWFYFRTVNTAP
jgi:hypothetical protein